jgi:16S rRNA (cytidine1402-2'-O)-methyltransferase
VAVCRELTKTHEQVLRGPAGTLAVELADGVLGEVTLVIGAAAAGERAGSLTAAVAAVDGLVLAGTSRRDAVADVAARLGLPRRAVYQAVLDAAAATPDGGP